MTVYGQGWCREVWRNVGVLARRGRDEGHMSMLTRAPTRLVGGLAVAAVAVRGLACAGPAAAALPANCSVSPGTVTCTFSYTGAAQVFTVPAGVSSVRVDARGA